MLTIKSSNKRVVKSLRTLYQDILKVNDNLEGWKKELLQNDNLYFNLRVIEKVGVIKMKQPKPHEVIRFRLLPDLKQRTNENANFAIRTELIRVGIVHLYVQGFNTKQITNFNLNF